MLRNDVVSCASVNSERVLLLKQFMDRIANKVRIRWTLERIPGSMAPR